VAVQAIRADPDVPATMHLHQVQEPSPGPGQVVITVQHISLNFGDLNDARSGRVPPGASNSPAARVRMSSPPSARPLAAAACVRTAPLMS
jgi:NADPH:quinone reductase-like Zn-dependent oxidoreductase